MRSVPIRLDGLRAREKERVLTTKQNHTRYAGPALPDPVRESSLEAADQHEVQVRRTKNRAAIALLRRWLKEGPVCDEKTWQAFKRSIEEGRLSDRERFSD